LYALSNHARHHEITAMRAAGISLWRLASPYFMLGFVGSLAMFALSEYWVPDTREIASAIKNQYKNPDLTPAEQHTVRHLGFISFKSGSKRTWQVGAYDLQSGEMRDVQVDWAQPDGTHPWMLAKRGVFTNRSWTFHDVQIFTESPGTNSRLIPVINTNLFPLPGFTETPEEIQSEIKISKRLGFGRKFQGVDIPIREILDYLRLHPNPTETDKRWLLTKLHGRLASPWTCFVVVLIALPFGAASGRRSLFVGVAGSILICFCYYVVQRLGMALGTGGWVPPWMAGWLPNIGFAMVGAWLTARVR